jgi:hypothetical protein
MGYSMGGVLFVLGTLRGLRLDGACFEFFVEKPQMGCP